jgi:hypothetical protein
MSKYLFIYLVIILIHSCDKIDNVYRNKLIFSVEMKILEDDILEVYFDNRETNRFQSKDVIRKEIIGDTVYQKFNFIINKNVFPNRIRLDLGENLNQKKIQIRNIELKYNSGRHLFTKKEIKKYFRANIYLDFDFDHLVALPLVKPNKLYDPYLVSNNLSGFINRLILH